MNCMGTIVLLYKSSRKSFLFGRNLNIFSRVYSLLSKLHSFSNPHLSYKSRRKNGGVHVFAMFRGFLFFFRFLIIIIKKKVQIESREKISSRYKVSSGLHLTREIF